MPRWWPVAPRQGGSKFDPRGAADYPTKYYPLYGESIDPPNPFLGQRERASFRLNLNINVANDTFRKECTGFVNQALLPRSSFLAPPESIQSAPQVSSSLKMGGFLKTTVYRSRLALPPSAMTIYPQMEDTTRSQVLSPNREQNQGRLCQNK